MSRLFAQALVLSVMFSACGNLEGPIPPAHAAPMAVDVPDGSRGMGGMAPRGGEVDERTAVPEGRKVVRTASVSVKVAQWEPFDRDLRAWLTEHGGHISDIDVSRHDGRVSYASLTLRVPSDALDPLLGWAEERVSVQHLSVNSADVTAAWVDTEARLDTLRATEGRIVTLLAEHTASLGDILAAERELARLRGDIESFERQQRAMADQVSLSTVHVNVSVPDPNEKWAVLGALVLMGSPFVLTAMGVVGALLLAVFLARRRKPAKSG